ncbi:MAG: hypothetical protein QM789_07370 [Paenirhodobacter sp.]
MLRLLRHDRQARQHDSIIPGHHDLHIRVAFGTQIGIGPDNIVANGMFPGADLFQHGAGRGVELRIHRAEGRDQSTSLRRRVIGRNFGQSDGGRALKMLNG